MAEHQRKYKARLMAEGKWSEAEKCKRYRELVPGGYQWRVV